MLTLVATIAATVAIAQAHVIYQPSHGHSHGQVNVIPVASAPAPVYQYIPPSPLVPACPIGYTCCGNVKHYDPQQIKKCCGVKVYTPTMQSCAYGNVVSIVQAIPTTPPPPPPVYVQRTDLVCDGVAWRVPYPNYKCCGPTVYNVMTERCNLTNPHIPHPPTPAPAPSSPAPPTMPSTKEVICQGHRHTVPAGAFQFYACCGPSVYFWLRQQCVNGQIEPPLPVTTTTSATPLVQPVVIICDGIVHWIKPSDRPFLGCCGTATYDIRTERCSRPSQPAATNPVSSGCPARYVCCENYPPVENNSGLLRCCPNIGPYDPTVSNCPTL